MAGGNIDVSIGGEILVAPFLFATFPELIAAASVKTCGSDSCKAVCNA